jgi:hypothetical protein
MLQYAGSFPFRALFPAVISLLGPFCVLLLPLALQRTDALLRLRNTVAATRSGEAIARWNLEHCAWV